MYYDLAWGRIEDRDDSGCVLRQYVWGARYVDNIVEIAVNTDPEDDEEGPQSNQCLCEDFYYPVQDANFNVVGLVDSAGTLLERYEYTPYGERTVYKCSGSDDTTTSAPLYESQRVEVSGQPQAYSLCDLGHQGLFLDKEFSAYDNRRRVLSPPLARFLQRDPIGYWDGMGLYEYVSSRPTVYADPAGLYDSDVHYYMTYYLAYRCGLVGCKRSMTGGRGVDVGQAVAWSNQFTDDHPDTAPPSLGRGFYPPSNQIHFPVSDATEHQNTVNSREWQDRYGMDVPSLGTSGDTVLRDSRSANRAYKRAGKTDFYGKGVGLHSLQDSFSHEGLGSAGQRHRGHGQDDPWLNDRSKVAAMQMAKRTYDLFGKMMGDLGCPPCRCKEPWEKVRADVYRMFERAGSGNRKERAENWFNNMEDQGIEVPKYTHQGRDDPNAAAFLDQAYRAVPGLKP